MPLSREERERIESEYLQGSGPHLYTITTKDLDTLLASHRELEERIANVATDPVAVIFKLEAEVARLREALEKYGECQPGCLWHERNDDSECDCEWVACRAALREEGE